MPKIGDLMAVIGTYQLPQTGEEKTQWLKCGALFKKANGKMSVKLEALPVGQEGSGLWLNVFESRGDQNPQRQGQNTRPTPPQQASAAQPPAPVTHSDFADDDIPF